MLEFEYSPSIVMGHALSAISKLFGPVPVTDEGLHGDRGIAEEKLALRNYEPRVAT